MKQGSWMPVWTTCITVLTASLIPAASALGQVPAPPAFARAQKKIENSQRPADDPEQRDGRLGDAEVLTYVRGISVRVARTAGVKELDVHLTHARGWYARFVAPDLLYLSGGLLQRAENEAEVAGLLAHVYAHARETAPAAVQSAAAVEAPVSACVLAGQTSQAKPVDEQRDAEVAASQAALKTLRNAGYAPTAMLDLLSKMAYEQPAWGKAILPEDLMRLRRAVESEPLPPTGYIVDSSEFPEQHARVAKALERPVVRPSLSKAPPPI